MKDSYPINFNNRPIKTTYMSDNKKGNVVMRSHIVDIWYSIWDNSYNSWGNDQGQEKECYSRLRNWKIGRKNDDVVSSYGMIKVIVRESEIRIFGTCVKVPLGWSITTIEYSCLKQKAVGGGRELSFLRGQDSTYLSKLIFLFVRVLYSYISAHLGLVDL